MLQRKSFSLTLATMCHHATNMTTLSSMYIFICTGAEKTVTAKLVAEQIMICKCSVKRPHIDLQHFIVVAIHEQDIWQLFSCTNGY